MAKTITVEIPLIVGSNGKWCANGYTSTAEDGGDWSFMEESLQDEDGNFPAAQRRYVVRATVLVPDDAPEIVAGTLEA